MTHFDNKKNGETKDKARAKNTCLVSHNRARLDYSSSKQSGLILV